jgi:hypothetical protein
VHCTGTDCALDGLEGISESESESKGFVLWTGVPNEFFFLYIDVDILIYSLETLEQWPEIDYRKGKRINMSGAITTIRW